MWAIKPDPWRERSSGWRLVLSNSHNGRLLGFVGIALGITVPDQIADPAAIGPFVISHIGLPVALVVLFTLVVLNASFSATDDASRLSTSVVAVDIVRPLSPDLSERTLFLITRLSIVVAIIVGVIVLLGFQFVIFFSHVCGANRVAIPITLAIFASRFTGTRILVLACTLALLWVCRSTERPSLGTLAIFGISLVVSVVVAYPKARNRLPHLARSSAYVGQERRVEFIAETMIEPATGL